MRAGLLLLVAAVALLPLGAAAPATAELRLEPPLDLAGAVALASDGGVVALPPSAAFAGGAQLLNITLVRAPAPDPRPAAAPPPDPLLPLLPPAAVPAPRPPAPQVRYLEMADPEGLVVTSRQAGARTVLAVGPFDLGRIAWEGPAATVRLAGPGAAGALPPPFGGPSGDGWLAVHGAGAAELRGSVRGLFEGVGLVVQNRTASLQVDTTDHRDGGRWTAILRWTGAALRASGPDGMLLLAPALDLRADGVVRAARAWGGVAVDEEEGRDATGQQVEARGVLEGRLTPAGGKVRLRAAGDLASLTLGDQRQDYARAAAAGVGLALASALAYYAQHLRFLAIPLYARIAPSELLDNDVRRRVHAHVTQHPGADVKGTAEAVQVSWSTAAYHLSRLEREGLFTSRRAGRSKRFFLNGGASSGRAEAIGALRNPTSLAIAELVARQPGLMQKEIGAALQLPASTVSWHMRRLRGLGVVQEHRRWRRAEYAPGALWPELAAAVRGPAPA